MNASEQTHDQETSSPPREQVSAAPTLLELIWSFLSSFAIHIVATSGMIFAITFLQSPPDIALVEYSEVEFTEDSPSMEGLEGQSHDEGDEVAEQEQLTLEEADPFDETLAPRRAEDLEKTLEEGFRKGELEIEQDLQESMDKLFVGEGSYARQLERAKALAERIKKAHETTKLEVKPKSPAELEATPVEKKSPKIARDRYESQGRWAGKKLPTVLEVVKSRGDSSLLSGLVSKDIYVINGQLDSVENVLRFLDIPHRMASWDEFPDLLKPTRIFIINCSWPVINAENARKVKRFLEGGGYLMTTGWELRHVVMPSVPGVVDTKRIPTISFRGSVGPHRDAVGHPYLRDVFSLIPGKTSVTWKCMGAQADLPIALSPKVIPLIVSSDLEKRYRHEIISLTFRHGKGSVLHIMGHFQEQRNKQGAYTLQQMLVNFIIEKQRQRLR